MMKCDECPFFRGRNFIGHCTLNGYLFDRGGYCLYEKKKHFIFKPDAAEKVLHYYQKWRRGENIEMPSPTLVGKAIDTSIRTLRNLRHETENSKEDYELQS